MPGVFANGGAAQFPGGDTPRSHPAATVHVIPQQSKRPPKGAKAAKAKGKAKPKATTSAPPKSIAQPPIAQPPIVVTPQGSPAAGVPPAPPAIPKVASLQKAAQKKAARKQATAQQASAQAQRASAQARTGKPPQKDHKQAKSARQGTPPPILSSLQTGVTIVPAEQSHPLDWHEHGIAEAMDMRKRRPLSSLMMRRP